MIREKEDIYINGKMHSRDYKKFKKEKEHLKKLEDIQKNKNEIIKKYEEKVQTSEYKNLAKSDLEKTKKYIENDLENNIRKQKHMINLGNMNLKKMKPSYKKIPKEKLKLLVLKELLNNIQKKNTSISKEDTAIVLKVKSHEIEQIFMEFNRLGFMSKAYHKPLHDSNRDPWAIFSITSGWASDSYTIYEDAFLEYYNKIKKRG